MLNSLFTWATVLAIDFLGEVFYRFVAEEFIFENLDF